MRIGYRAALALLGLGCAAVSASAESAAIADFIDRARGADIVVLGEIHDNPTHHANQAEIVRALRPAALVFEMIPQQSEETVNELRANGASEAAVADALDWGESGWPDFNYYWPILQAAPHAQIFGAGQPRADVSRASVEGAAGVFGPDAATYGLDIPLPPEEEKAREAAMAEAHCGLLPSSTLPGMVEAQRFRDAGLADAAIWARTMTGGGQVVVITGSGHADKTRGMPALVATAAPDLKLVSLGQFEAAPETTSQYDGILLAPAPARADPCAQLEPKARPATP